MLTELRAMLNLPVEEADALLEIYLALAEEYVLNYCHIDVLPEGLTHTVCQMAADAYRRCAEGSVKSIKEGDSQVEYLEIVDDYRAQLNNYRKVKTV